MCGITGIVDFSSQPKKTALIKSLNKITHRGPDSSGCYIDKNVALGVRRLSIIDLKTGDQPISNEDNLITIVFNGEIYNFKSLRQMLVEKGHKFKTKTDTEVLVHLYEVYGDSMMKFLNGMFAFAIWDKKKNKLFIGRDHAGIKPLYYLKQGSKIFFGSEVKTILSFLNGSPSVNNESLALYTFLGYIPGDNSIFEGIKKLPPGHYLTFDKNGLKLVKYYQVKINQKAKIEKLDDLLKDAVSLQSVADVPLGVFLSGGLDSSIVTYYLTMLKHNVKTFSITFEEGSFDESEYALLVAKRLQTKHYQDSFSVNEIPNLFDKITDQLDEPLSDPSLFPTFKVSALAKKNVKVALSGDGGDELFGGYPTYQGHILAERFKWIPKAFLDNLTKSLKILPRTFENFPTKEVLTSFLLGISKPAAQRHIFWMSLFSQGQKELLDISKTNWYKKEILSLKGEQEDLLKKMQLLDFNTYLADDLLTKVDRASMINSLEVRVPFLDPRIIEFAYGSSKNHVDLLVTKKHLRNLLKDLFPKSITKRKKKGFGIPLSKWLCFELKDLAYDHLKSKKLNNFFKPTVIERVWKNHQEGKENNAKIIWMLVMFSSWLSKWSN